MSNICSTVSFPWSRNREAKIHLDGCTHCREKVAEAKREEVELGVQLTSVDHPPPRIDAATLAASVGTHRVQWMRWAAGLALGIGVSGVAYAVPRSPVPVWVSAVVDWIAEEQVVTTSDVWDEVGDIAERGGVGVDPGDRLIIQISGVTEDSYAQVLLTAGAEVEVRGESVSTSFTSDPGRLSIDGLGSDTIQVAIPLSAPYVEIRLRDRIVMLKENASVRTSGADLSGPGPFLVPLVADPR